MAKSDERRVHPYIPRLVEQLEARRVDRREFLRTATLLGLSSAAAYGIAGRILGENLVDPALAQSGTPKKGGILRVAMEVQKMDDPATYSWVQMSNQTRHIAEYLAITGPDNVTRPMLAESWEASDDLKTWTFKLRQGVMWHNGEEFVADHVVWNVERWRNPDLGSSNVGLSTFASMDSVEAVDPHTVRFNLNKPVLSAPEDCYNYPTAILHPSFTPPFSDNPIGTGPYMLGEPLAVGDRCILKRITQTTDGQEFKYWGEEPYLDEIHYYHYDADNQLTAFASGDVDTVYTFGIEQFEFAEALPGEIVAAETAQTMCLRFKVTEAPFDNLKLRQAVNYAIDRAAQEKLVGGTIAGEPWSQILSKPLMKNYVSDTAAYPTSPDLAKAKQLVQESGVATPINITMAFNNSNPLNAQSASAFKSDLQQIGFNVTVKPVDPSAYYQTIQNPKKSIQLGWGGWTQDYSDGSTFFGPLLGYTSQSNYGQFQDKALQANIDKVSSMASGPDREKAWATLSDSTERDSAPWAVYANRNFYELTSNRYGGYAWNPTKQRYYALAFIK
jgi:peptide/nickel transport system substrate-binding protein